MLKWPTVCYPPFFSMPVFPNMNSQAPLTYKLGFSWILDQWLWSKMPISVKLKIKCQSRSRLESKEKINQIIVFYCREVVFFLKICSLKLHSIFCLSWVFINLLRIRVFRIVAYLLLMIITDFCFIWILDMFFI